MYDNQDMDNGGLDLDDEKKNYVGIIVGVLVVIVFIVVGFMFFKFYSGGNVTDNSEENASSMQIIDNESKAESVAEASEEQSVEESKDEAVSEESESSENSELSESSEEISEEVSVEPEHGWVINNMGYTYLYQGAGFNQFNGTKALAEKYAAALNKLTSTVSFPVYSIIAPTSVEFVDIPYDVKQSDDFYNSSQKTFISNVNNASNSSAVDVYTAISSKVSDEYLYMKTDKNWTADAAYYAYVEFCNSVGQIPASRASYEKGSYSGYLGNFYNATSSGRLKANADTVNYYKVNALYPCVVTMYRGGLAYKDRALIYTQLSNPTSYAYYAFLGDRGETFTINSQNSASEKSLLVVGDSSAFAFVPYLAANYRNIYFVNAESFKGKISEYISDKTIDEAVVLSYATSAVTASYVNGLGNVFENQQ